MLHSAAEVIRLSVVMHSERFSTGFSEFSAEEFSDFLSEHNDYR
jgi:hypothetical protein